MRLEDKKMKVLFEDNHLLAVVKPAHLVTQASPHSKDSLEEQVKEKLRKNNKSVSFVHPIHRLDKEVSGIVLFARTSKALSRLQKEQRERNIEKRYLAWVEGAFPNKEGELKHFLVKKEFKAFIDKTGKESLLHYTLLKKTRDASLLEIELKTGRYHQIRAQLSHIGHPILGDHKYGGKQEAPQILLHHYKISFCHPTLKEWTTVIDQKGKEIFLNYL